MEGYYYLRIAIKEGVYKSLQMTDEHFRALYANTPFEYFLYDSSKVGQVRDFATSLRTPTWDPGLERGVPYTQTSTDIIYNRSEPPPARWDDLWDVRWKGG